MTEIDKDWYCSAGCKLNDGECCIFSRLNCEKDHCQQRHRKWPTPEQFKEEYDKEISDEMPVWVLRQLVMKLMLKGEKFEDSYLWVLDQYGTYKHNTDGWNNVYTNMNANFSFIQVIALCVACTPWGKPPDDWRPE